MNFLLLRARSPNKRAESEPRDLTKIKSTQGELCVSYCGEPTSLHPPQKRDSILLAPLFSLPIPILSSLISQSEFGSGGGSVDFLAGENEQKMPSVQVSFRGGRRAAVRGEFGRSVQVVVQASARKAGQKDSQRRLELQTLRLKRQVKLQ